MLDEALAWVMDRARDDRLMNRYRDLLEQGVFDRRVRIVDHQLLHNGFPRIPHEGFIQALPRHIRRRTLGSIRTIRRY